MMKSEGRRVKSEGKAGVAACGTQESQKSECEFRSEKTGGGFLTSEVGFLTSDFFDSISLFTLHPSPFFHACPA
jgi:hypothetical protein